MLKATLSAKQRLNQNMHDIPFYFRFGTASTSGLRQSSYEFDWKFVTVVSIPSIDLENLSLHFTPVIILFPYPRGKQFGLRSASCDSDRKWMARLVVEGVFESYDLENLCLAFGTVPNLFSIPRKKYLLFVAIILYLHCWPMSHVPIISYGCQQVICDVHPKMNSHIFIAHSCIDLIRFSAMR